LVLSLPPPPLVKLVCYLLVDMLTLFVQLVELPLLLLLLLPLLSQRRRRLMLLMVVWICSVVEEAQRVTIKRFQCYAFPIVTCMYTY
jgi:hypothetical protein